MNKGCAKNSGMMAISHNNADSKLAGVFQPEAVCRTAIDNGAPVAGGVKLAICAATKR